jgi:hypothetical protein
MMGLEMPAISAAMARLDEPKVNLAAFGGLVFPLALLVEAPIIMMLAASTSLSRNPQWFRRLRWFMYQLSLWLTVIHAAIAFTPLYDVLAVSVIGVPDEIIEPGRTGLRLMLPWTAAIADRRFHQGVLIRFGMSKAVGIGTFVRVIATGSMLLIGYHAKWPGIVVGSAALSVGVIVEMVYTRIVVAPVLRGPLQTADGDDGPLRFGYMLAFYVPLALTPLLGLLAQPIGAAAMSRMPDPLLSLAAWPAVNGLIFLTRSVGFAYNEVVVNVAGRPNALPVLRRFNAILCVSTVSILLLVAVTPLGRLWFARLCGLDAELTSLSTPALLVGLLLPALSVIHSYYQGILVESHRTRGIPESVTLALSVCGLILALGIWWSGASGLYVTIVAFSAGGVAQSIWLWLRCRPAFRVARETRPFFPPESRKPKEGNDGPAGLPSDTRPTTGKTAASRETAVDC